ncbi:flagellar assembly protein FliW [Clostridium ganghwense]|uniref:Flagellar assembly factor FliW n=1 Tax=Clostridium ganghwense TaxID=312089 RepID=A0ABT4CPQ6_9CLOT|nr:flagellar assembly protein FliW [Clostridium ganghwense]MCY6370423.1 flagellar assembly protein FliW [Clostridium ganghwense]
MEFKTKYHGVREYEKKDIVTFHKGVPGFEDLRKFIIFNVEDNEMFSILHSIENSEVGFIVVSPFYVKKDYEIKLDDNLVQRLKVEKPEDVMLLNTVTISSNVEEITANLRAPIIINIKEKLGEQIILNNEEYLVKYPLFKEET